MVQKSKKVKVRRHFECTGLYSIPLPKVDIRRLMVPFLECKTNCVRRNCQKTSDIITKLRNDLNPHVTAGSHYSEGNQTYCC